MKDYKIVINFNGMLSIIFFVFIITDAYNRVGEMGSCDPFTVWEITYSLFILIAIFIMGATSKIKIRKK